MHRNSRRARFGVAVDGRGLLSHSGTAALRELADRIGLTDALSAAAAPVCSAGLVHEPGAVLRDLVVMLADGGDDFSAIETLRGQADLDGPVASDSTAWRRVADLAGHELSVVRLDAARRRVRATVWRRGGAPPAVAAGSGLVCVDVDATLVTAHSDKESAAGTYKRGFGFHPLLAYLDRDDGTGEALAGQLRAGNAGANTAADHIDVFETAIDQLDGVDPARVLVRADSAGSSQAFLGYLGEAGVGFSVGARLDEQVRAAIRIAASRPVDWTPAVRQDGQVRDGAHVTEITGSVDVSAYPAGTRILVRREPLHPGAQQTFDDLDGHRFTALLTTQTDADLAALDARHRAHARVEQRIRDAKTLGLRNLPSADFAINQIWLQLVLLAQDLLAWFAVLTLDGDLAVATPATVRYRLLHVAGRITRSSRRVTLHLDATWPWATDLAEAFRRLHALPTPA
ncbi:MAG TPA: IS1380 family transposase [Euzebyales bacterium]